MDAVRATDERALESRTVPEVPALDRGRSGRRR